MIRGILLFFIIIMVGCSTTNERIDGQVTNSSTENNFKLELVAEKETFQVDEIIDIETKLHYIGTKNEVEIFHAKPAFLFTVEQLDGDVKLTSTIAQVEIQSTLTRKEPLAGYLSNLIPIEGASTLEDLKRDSITLLKGLYKIMVEAIFTYNDEPFHIATEIEINVQ